MTVLAAALSALMLSMIPATGQTAPVTPASRPAVVAGVSPAAVVAWLNTQGAVAGAVQEEQGRKFVRVDADGLAWRLYFPSCQGDRCSDVQFTTGVANAAITPDLINGWNRDRRFLKAIYEAPTATAPASAVIQYDVLLNSGGPEQLTDHLAIWRSLLPEFARLTTGGAASAPPAAPK
ncbi:MAG TPA: YbjN domain-containing protein [Brevundimonas sp.]|jgi:hypothetical protein